ncbi:MAG TPA: type II toxin-antitoxin system prevent-host-death family antitoxin [bacterium]|nr:type II toxin-antitoxin system prevent-host-death family antitoxin [bacterium]
MEEIGVYEAKTHLPALLERVAKGEKITITKHGKPIALLVPTLTEKKRSIEEVIAELKKFRKSQPRISQKEIRALIDEGRR